MKKDEKKLTGYIDELNAEKMPKDHRYNAGKSEYQKLMDTVRKVRTLREPEYPEYPGEDYQIRLVAALKGGISTREKSSGSRFIKRALLFTTVAAAAAVILFVSLNGVLQKVIIPSQEAVIDKPRIEVEFDLVVEENDQKSVDAGHSPWKLDPVFVTQVFASLLISPEGIVGDYPIAYEDIKIVENNGVEAIAKINSKESIARKVYLKRLIRQDDTGIWTVVGYDPVD